MPWSSPRPCTQPGCSALVRNGSRCPRHPYAQRRSARAIEYNKWYKTARWRENKAAFLSKNPYCVDCQAIDKRNKATLVDHKIPHRGDPVRFWDQSNWQGLCNKHHSRKTASRDGGFGNARKGGAGSISID